MERGLTVPWALLGPELQHPHGTNWTSARGAKQSICSGTDPAASGKPC